MQTDVIQAATWHKVILIKVINTAGWAILPCTWTSSSGSASDVLVYDGHSSQLKAKHMGLIKIWPFL